MIPFGLSSAAAVRVGQAVGRLDLRSVRVAGWMALIAFVYALVMSALFVGVPRFFCDFHSDETLLRTGGLRPPHLCGVSAVRRHPDRRDRGAPRHR